MMVTALLIGLAIIIPVISFRIDLPPFSATVASHVPIIIAMFISPFSALFVAAGSALGFFFRGVPMVIVARAATHVIFAAAGAYMVRKRFNVVLTGALTMLIHALAEAVVVIPFLSPEQNIIYFAFYVTGVGTALHHVLDYIIAFGVLSALSASKAIPKMPKVWGKE